MLESLIQRSIHYICICIDEKPLYLVFVLPFSEGDMTRELVEIRGEHVVDIQFGIEFIAIQTASKARRRMFLL